MSGKGLRRLSKAYRIIEKVYISEISADCYHLRHERSGMDVFRIVTDDEESFFSFSFDTTPEDSRGAAHIIEHCVLSGSENYDIAEPFETCTSLCALSYANAETHQDWTSYLVASAVDRDFKSAFRMYADAVFNPLLKRATFLKEGIRGVFGSDGELLGFSGVIFNEVQEGVRSRSYREYEALRRFLSKGSGRFDSGGRADEIPFLSYRELISFYRRKYSAGNCILTLYGKESLDSLLGILDKEVLTAERFFAGATLPLPGSEQCCMRYEDFKSRHGDGVSMSYIPLERGGGYALIPFSAQDNLKPSFCMAFDTGVGLDDPIRYRLLTIMAQALLGAPDAPLYKGLTDLGLSMDIGDDTGIVVFDGKVFFVIALDDLLISGNAQEMAGMCESKVRGLLSGLFSELGNSLCFQNAIKTLKVEIADRSSTPRGRLIAERIMSSPFHDLSLCEPYACLEEVQRMFERNQDLFKEMFDAIFLQPDAIFYDMVFIASEDFDKFCDERMTNLIAHFGENADLDGMRNDAKLFEESVSSHPYLAGKDANDLFPVAPLGDIVRMMRFCNTASALAKDAVSALPDRMSGADHKTLKDYPDRSGGIVVRTCQSGAALSHIHIAFSLDDIAQDSVWLLQILAEALLRADVGRIVGFHERFHSLIHSLGINILSLPPIADFEREAPYMVFSFKALKDDAGEGLDLLASLLCDADITAQTAKESVRSLQSEYADISYSASDLSRHMALSDVCAGYLFTNAAKGILFKGFLDFVKSDDEQEMSLLAQSLKVLAGRIFTRRNMVFSHFCDDFEPSVVVSFARRLPDSEGDGRSERKGRIIKADGMAEVARQGWNIRFGNYGGGSFSFYPIPSSVSYPSVAIRCKARSSELDVISTYLQDVELYRKVRVESGAYGAYFDYNYYSGVACISSIRDPNGIGSFKKFFEALHSHIDNEALRNAKRSFLMSISYPQSDGRKSFACFSRFVQDITDDERKFRVSKARSVTLRQCRLALEEMFESNVLVQGGKAYALIGDEMSLNANSSDIRGFMDFLRNISGTVGDKA